MKRQKYKSLILPEASAEDRLARFVLIGLFVAAVAGLCFLGWRAYAAADAHKQDIRRAQITWEAERRVGQETDQLLRAVDTFTGRR